MEGSTFMNKKTVKILLYISIAIAILGIILILINKPSYERYKDFLAEYSEYLNYKSYVSDLKRMKEYATLYFSGIALTVFGGLSSLFAIICNKKFKDDKQVLTYTDNYLD